MTFIRPEISRSIYRWRGVLGMGLLACLGLWFYSRGGWFFRTLGGFEIIVAVLFMVPLIQRARFHPPHEAPGLVEITERQIRYYGPVEGATVALAALTRLEIRKSEAFGSVWVLHHRDGPALLIPTSAQGAEQLFDAFSPLEGLNTEAMIQATQSPNDRTYLIWEAVEI